MNNNFLDYVGYTDIYQSDDYLQHYGIRGMHWGIRRYQNEDGSLTAAGRSRYNVNNWEDVKISDEAYEVAASFGLSRQDVDALGRKYFNKYKNNESIKELFPELEQISQQAQNGNIGGVVNRSMQLIDEHPEMFDIMVELTDDIAKINPDMKAAMTLVKTEITVANFVRDCLKGFIQLFKDAGDFWFGKHK